MRKLLHLSLKFSKLNCINEKGWFNWYMRQSLQEKIKRLEDKRSLTPIIFFVCVYLYFRLVVDFKLIYHGFGMSYESPVFSKGLPFLKSFLQYPGGLIDYLSVFLSQLYYYSWLGALIITLVAGGLYLVTKKLITLAGGGRKLSFVSYIPAIILLISYNNYYHPLTAGLALLTVLLFSVVHEKISVRINSSCLNLILFSLEFIILYYIAAGAALLFVIVTIAFELLIRRRLISSGLFPAAAFITVGLVGYYFFRLGIEQSFLYLTPFYKTINIPLAQNPERIINICLYLFFPFTLLPILLWYGIIRRKKPVQNDRIDSHGRLKLVICTTVLIVTSLVTIYFSFNGVKKDVRITLYMTEHQMWPGILAYVKNVSLPLNRYGFFHAYGVNLALYHTGQLAENMFSYPQRPGSLLPLTTYASGSGKFDLVGSNVLIELGQVNLAEKRTFELFEMVGDNPSILQRLALINIVKGQTRTARVFLNVLAKDLIYGKQATELLHRLDNDPNLSDDQQIRYLRSVRPTKDVVIYLRKPEPLLLNLLDSNRRNKMAFEYLMAKYLTTNHLDKFVQNIRRLNDFDYQKIPRHYEEAILIYSKLTRKEVDLHGRKISRKTIERSVKFFDTLSRLIPDKKAAYNALKEDFGNSYFFYNVFGISGVGR